MRFLQISDNPLDHVVAHPIWQIEADLGGLLTPEGVVTVLSDQLLMMAIGAVLLMVGLPLAVRRRRGTSEIERRVPAGAASFIELVCEYFRKEVAEPHLGKTVAPRFLHFIWTAFFFVLTMNLLGLIPLAVLSPWVGHHIGGTATANIWVTATLAITVLVMMVWNGLRYGGKAYLAHFSPGPLWLAPLMIPVEIMGLFAKIFALSVRLFANMVAGHVLLAVLLAMILRAGTALGPIGGGGVAVAVVAGSVAINLLEIFVAFLQAFIFTYLSTLFIGMSVNVHPHDEGHEAHAAPEVPGPTEHFAPLPVP